MPIAIDPSALMISHDGAVKISSQEVNAFLANRPVSPMVEEKNPSCTNGGCSNQSGCSGNNAACGNNGCT